MSVFIVVGIDELILLWVTIPGQEPTAIASPVNPVESVGHRVLGAKIRVVGFQYKVLLAGYFNRQIDSDPSGNFGRPGTGGVHDDFGRYLAVIGGHPTDPVCRYRDAGHRDALHDFDAARAGDIGKSLSRRYGVGVTPAVFDQRTPDAVGVDSGNLLFEFVNGQQIRFHPERSVPFDEALHLGAHISGSDLDPAGLTEHSGAPGAVFKLFEYPHRPDRHFDNWVL